MRTTNGLIAAVLLLTLSAAAHAAEKDWSQMNVDERTAWASAYTKQTCPWMPPPTKEEIARKGEIAGAYQWMVKAYLNNKCPSKSANAK